MELFDIAQSNSEHSRHWFFGGNMVIDGEKKDRSLFVQEKFMSHILLSAETHNFPSGVAPFPGAE